MYVILMGIAELPVVVRLRRGTTINLIVKSRTVSTCRVTPATLTSPVGFPRLSLPI